MRITVLTGDPEVERRFLHAAEECSKGLCILHSEAQVLERQFRDPFDALIADAPIERIRRMCAFAPHSLDNLFLLLHAPVPNGPLPTEVIYGFGSASSAETVLKRVESLSHVWPIRQTEERTAISAALQRVGVPVHLKGFFLLKEAIRLSLHLDRPSDLRMETDVYASLADTYQTPVSVVEHAMRHAIEAAWLRADARVLERMFGYTVCAERATPSNAAFLFQMREHIRIERNRGRFV